MSTTARALRTSSVAARLAAGLAAASLVWATAVACTKEDPRFDDYELVFFSSCDDALAALRGASKQSMGSYGLPNLASGWGWAMPPVMEDRGGQAADPAVPPAPGDNSAEVPSQPDHSGTNTHESGVDEPDLVKTDGQRIVTISAGRLSVVDVATRRLVGMVNLAEDGELPWVGYGAQLLLAGDHALVISSGGYDYGGPVLVDPAPAPGPGRPDDPAPDAPNTPDERPVAVPSQPTDVWPVTGTTLVLVDLTGPRVLSRAIADGYLVDARQIGSTAHLVLRSAPRLVFPAVAGSEAERIAANRATIDSAGVGAWAPRLEVTTNGQTTQTSVPCDAISRPAAYTGANMLTILSFDAGRDALDDGNPVTVAADGETVYSNGTSLYVASGQAWMRGVPAMAGVAPEQPRTEIYRFDITGSTPRYAAGGSVPGMLLNQYSLSEWDGRLRVATTSDTPNSSHSGVYVLAMEGDRLVQVGAVDGLGRGERIYAVRFVGPVGYVVTFRQMDPLYTVDLRNPTAPVLRGELHIPGYSAYLHPAGDDRLIGVGQDANSNGQVLGLAVSLFDVADLTDPALLSRFTLSGAWSEAEGDAHAFLYWPQTGMLVVPLDSPYGVRPVPDGVVEDGGGSSGSGGDVAVPPPADVPTATSRVAASAVPEGATGALILRVDGDQLVEVGFVEHPDGDYGYPASIRRSLVTVDGAGRTTLWTLSDRGLMATDATSLERLAWIAV